MDALEYFFYDGDRNFHPSVENLKLVFPDLIIENWEEDYFKRMYSTSRVGTIFLDFSTPSMLSIRIFYNEEIKAFISSKKFWKHFCRIKSVTSYEECKALIAPLDRFAKWGISNVPQFNKWDIEDESNDTYEGEEAY